MFTFLLSTSTFSFFKLWTILFCHLSGHSEPIWLGKCYPKDQDKPVTFPVSKTCTAHTPLTQTWLPAGYRALPMT